MRKREVEKKRSSNSKLSLSWILVIFVIILVILILYTKSIKDLIYKNIYNNITELSEQTATQLNLAITDQKKFVEIMVDSINRGFFKSSEEIFDRFRDDLSDYKFTRLVILDRSGNGTTSDGYTVSNYSNIQEFFNQDDVYVSDNRPSTVSDNQVNIYSKKFTMNGEEKVLMATINTADYKNILLRRLFNKGGTYLINNDGHILIDSFDLIKDKTVTLYEHMETTHHVTQKSEAKKIIQMKENIKNKQIGTFDIKFDDEVYFIHYEKVNINDWYVVTTAANSTIAKELITLIVITQGFSLLVSLIIISICVYINISNQKVNNKLYKVAYIDPVTSLGNEGYFKANGKLFLEKYKNNTYIFSLDINKFKALNNIHGYDFCNKILKKIGENIVSILTEDAIVSRISNDVFAFLIHDNKDIENLLKDIFDKVSNIVIDGVSIHLNLSVGVYKIKNEDTDINRVLDKAYMARAKIKGLYDKSYYIFDDILENKLVEEQKIESCMESALKNKEFKVIYQPKIFTNNEKIAGAEALVRWYKDDKIIPPNKFIPLFEANKFIIKLDLYIFEQVCKDLNEWKEKYNFMPIVSINVSKAHFVSEKFIEEYVNLTDKYNIDRKYIDLEITESAMIDEGIDVLEIFKSIKSKGFTISIDDFGTGYSSLSMLQSMPIDVLKIDKVFVDKADLNSNKNIINYIMLIALQLGVKTIVEGVETKEQMEFIKKIKGDIIQGYYYSKPLIKEEFEDYFNKNK